MSPAIGYPDRISRRTVLAQLLGLVAPAMLSIPRAAAIGTPSLLDIGLLRYDSSGYDPRPGAIARWLMEVEVTTSVTVAATPSEVELDRDGLFDCPLVVLAGDRAFDAWTDSARETLGLYLQAGGLLFVDSSEGRADGGFIGSVARELASIVPNAPIERVPSDHVVHRSFYLVDGAPGRLALVDWLDGVTLDDRLAVIICHNDMLGAIARDALGNWQYEVAPGGDRQRTMAHRLGVNLVMYALCLDYKDDQVHVPFLLERRRWRVE